MDGTVRPQVVKRAVNKRYWQLIDEFEKITGYGIILNTSFNVRGEPIVNTPENAFNCFMGSELDILVIGNCYLKKTNQKESLKINYNNRFELD